MSTFAFPLVAGTILFLALGPLPANSPLSVLLGCGAFALIAVVLWRMRQACWGPMAWSLFALPLGYAVPAVLLEVVR